jgi:hypothetical protein
MSSLQLTASTTVVSSGLRVENVKSLEECFCHRTKFGTIIAVYLASDSKAEYQGH